MSEVDPEVPHSARVYDYWLGGKDNFAADRLLGEAMLEALPGLRETAAQNRMFVHRVAHELVCGEGIRQFLDIGSGIPARPNLHEIAQWYAPETRVVYVDNDPLVRSHSLALLVSDPDGRVEFVTGDLREPATILSDETLRDTLDPNEPVGLCLIAVLMLIPDPAPAVAHLREAMPPGSLLAVSHPTADFDPEAVGRAVEAATSAGLTLVARSRDEVARFFGDWELLDPGLVPVAAWRPDDPVDDPDRYFSWAGVARKPGAVTSDPS